MVVDGDSSDLVMRVGWHHMVIVFVVPISLSRSGTIGQDEVEELTFTISTVVFKTNKGAKDSTFNHFVDLSLTRKFKHSFAGRLDAYYL